MVNELNNDLRRYNGRRYLDIHFLRSFRGVRMSDEYVKAVFNKLIIELDEALLKAKASLDYYEDKKLIDDAWEKTITEVK